MFIYIFISRKNLSVCYTDLKTDINRQNGRYYVKTSRRCYVIPVFFTPCNFLMLCPCHHQIWSISAKNTVTMAKKHAKLTFLCHTVATSLRHDIRSPMVRCPYAMSMSPPNLKLSGQKTRSQGPKNHQNGRFCVITSRRRYVMTLFPQYNAPIPLGWAKMALFSYFLFDSFISYPKVAIWYIKHVQKEKKCFFLFFNGPANGVYKKRFFWVS